MDKKELIGIILAGAAAIALAATNAIAADSVCDLGPRTFPSSGITDTVFGTCTHTSAGRGTNDATFVARNQGGTKTLSVTMNCCTTTTATIIGLGLFGEPIAGCSATARPGVPASVTCNGARSWRGTFTYFN